MPSMRVHQQGKSVEFIIYSSFFPPQIQSDTTVSIYSFTCTFSLFFLSRCWKRQLSVLQLPYQQLVIAAGTSQIQSAVQASCELASSCSGSQFLLKMLTKLVLSQLSPQKVFPNIFFFSCHMVLKNIRHRNLQALETLP